MYSVTNTAVEVAVKHFKNEIRKIRLTQTLRRKARRDLLVALIAVTLLTAISFVFELDVLESLYTFTRSHEDLEVDEILIVFLWVGLAGSLYAVRRMKDIKRLNQEIATYAFIDPITSLPNRSLAIERLQQKLAAAQRQQHQFAVVFIDFDHFKRINDTYGHSEGDILIRAVGQRLRGAVRKSDTLGRLGGDEFLIILDVKNEHDLMPALLRLEAVQHKPFELSENQVNLTFSIGVSLFPNDGATAEALLKAADTAMYRSKQLRNGQHAFYTTEMGELLNLRYQFESSIKTAIERDEFFLEYQPQYSIHSQLVSGYEAFIRWNREGVVIPPADFIGVAEETGLIEQLGFWTIKTALAEAKQFLQPGQTLAINISSRQLKALNFADKVQKYLSKLNFDPAQLELELTETTLSNETPQSKANLMALHELGIKIAIDDFGSGYSCLSRLRELPVSRIKIDKIFINHLGKSNIDDQMVSCILSMSQNLGLEVVAEGVETELQLKKLQQINCTYAQGYFFNHPMNLNALMRSNRLSQY